MSLKAKTLALGFSALVPLCASALGADAPKPGDQILLSAREVLYNPDAQSFTAQGAVEIDYGGRILLADEVHYDQKTDVVTADGHVSVMEANGDVAFAKHVVLKDQMRDGAMTGFGAYLGKNGRIAASSANRQGGSMTTAYNVVYSPCKICNQPGQRTPVWQVKAFRVIHDEKTHRIKFKDASIDFFGIPLLYTPYLAEPDPSVRHATGFLTPDIGSSSSIGYFLRLPYYVSFSPSRDMTLEPVITTTGGDLLLSEYRERSDNGGMWLQGSIGENPEGGLSEKQSQVYSHFFGSGRFPVSPLWQAGFDAQVTSNQTYLKRYDISQLDRLASDAFLVGEDGRSRFAITGYFFQGLRATDDNRTFPIALPLIEYSYIPLHKWGGGQFRFDINSVALSRDLGTNDQRLTAEMRWRAPYVAADGELWTLQIDARGDLYHTDTLAAPGDSHFITRGLPNVALDWRWPFIAEGKNGRSTIIEPIAQLVMAPYGGNPAGLPNEDSQDLGVDDNNIFTFDQVPGYDVAETGPRANFGFRAEQRFNSGYVEALLGQTFRLKSFQLVSNSAILSDTGLTGTSSDLVGRVSLKFPPYLDLTQRIDYDEQTGTVRRNEVYLTGILGRTSTQISYVQLAPQVGLPARQEINAQADVNFYENWQAFAAIRHDLIANQTLDTEFGLGYEDECLGVSVAVRRKYTADLDLPPSTSYVLRFNLKTTDGPVQAFSLFPEDVFSYTHP